MTEQGIQWYAVRTKPTAVKRRAVAGKGSSGAYIDRAGKKRKAATQQEFTIETLLRDRGFSVFLPTKKVYRRKSKYTKEKHLVTYPLLVGWVFVGWPKGENRWHDLFSCNQVIEVAGISRRPCPIPQADMHAMFNCWGGPKTRAPERERFMRTHHEFRVGDQVKVAEGPLEGLEVRVAELSGSRARVILELLGGAREIEIEAMSLEAN